MIEWIIEYWLHAFFGAVITVLTVVVRKLFTKYNATQNGIQALLRDRLVLSYQKYSERGNITLHGLEAVNKMFCEYKNLGGNGTISKLVEDLNKLPVVDD